MSDERQSFDLICSEIRIIFYHGYLEIFPEKFIVTIVNNFHGNTSFSIVQKCMSRTTFFKSS